MLGSGGEQRRQSAAAGTLPDDDPQAFIDWQEITGGAITANAKHYFGSADGLER